MTKTSLPSESVLVGREKELEKLESLLNSAINGNGITVLISGEAGTGKTKLTQEFLKIAKQRKKIAILKGWCLNDAGIPFFPFKEAFKGYLTKLTNKDDEVTSILKEQNKNDLANLNSWLNGSVGHSDFLKTNSYTFQSIKDWAFAAITNILSSLASEKPTVLFIDDLHWADSASLALLNYITRTIDSKRILVLATYRTEELYSNGGQPHSLNNTLRLIKREDISQEIELQNLSIDNVKQMAENMVGGPLDNEFSKKLASESQGNPLYVSEAIRMLHEKGKLIQNNGKWGLKVDKIEIPTKIKDIILSRIQPLTLDEKKLLNISSVIGTRIDPELLAGVLGLDKSDVIEKISSIALSSSLIVEEEKDFKFYHAKSRDVVYEAIPLQLRKVYHGKVAHILEQTKGNKFQNSDIAYHFILAGCKEKGIRYSIAAGQEALALFSGAEAIKHFSYVLDVVETSKEYPGDRDIALEGMGDSFYALGNLKEAAKVFENLSCEANSKLVAVRSLRKLVYVDHFLGDFSGSLESANKAMEIIKANPQIDHLEAARARLGKGLVERCIGNRKAAILNDEEAVSIFEEDNSLFDLVEALPELAWAYADDGQLEKALSQAIRAYKLGSYAVSVDKQDMAVLVLSLILFFCGLQKESEAINSAEFTLADKIIDPVSRWWNKTMSHKMKAALIEIQAAEDLFSKMNPADGGLSKAGNKIDISTSEVALNVLSEFICSLRKALGHGIQAGESSEETDSKHLLGLSYSSLLRLLSQVGDIEQADKYYRKMESLFQSSLKDYAFLRADWLASEAIYFSANHNWKESNKLYEEVIEIRKRLGPSNFSDAMYRLGYGWSLSQQKQMLEAKEQFAEAKTIMADLQSRFAQSILYCYNIMPSEVTIGEEFSVRLDIVNAGRGTCSLGKIEGLVVPNFKVSVTDPILSEKDEMIELQMRKITSFEDLQFNFKFYATKDGIFSFNPRLHYVDELGKSRICLIGPLRITVKSEKKTSSVKEIASIPLTSLPLDVYRQLTSFDFKTESANKSFEYLVDSFVLDYMRRRLPLEWSGWRTLMEIVRATRITKRSLYGEKGYRGRAISELEKRGLIELRVFPKERGRGGRVLKVRVFYEREVIKRIVDKRVRRSGKKETERSTPI